MCFGIPMEVIQVEGFAARCSVKGVERDVSLFFIQDEPVAAGDFVMVHQGRATHKISREEAAYAWALYDEILADETESDG